MLDLNTFLVKTNYLMTSVASEYFYVFEIDSFRRKISNIFLTFHFFLLFNTLSSHISSFVFNGGAVGCILFVWFRPSFLRTYQNWNNKIVFSVASLSMTVSVFYQWLFRKLLCRLQTFVKCLQKNFKLLFFELFYSQMRSKLPLHPQKRKYKLYQTLTSFIMFSLIYTFWSILCSRGACEISKRRGQIGQEGWASELKRSWVYLRT